MQKPNDLQGGIKILSDNSHVFIHIPKSGDEALKVHREKRNTAWYDTTQNEMGNVRKVFQKWDGTVQETLSRK